MIRTIREEESGDDIEYHDYAAMWGCDAMYDRPPRMKGDGYLFYNFASGGMDDGEPKSLQRFLAAISRTIEGEENEAKRRELQALWDHVAQDLRAGMPDYYAVCELADGRVLNVTLFPACGNVAVLSAATDFAASLAAENGYKEDEARKVLVDRDYFGEDDWSVHISSARHSPD